MEIMYIFNGCAYVSLIIILNFLFHWTVKTSIA